MTDKEFDIIGHTLGVNTYHAKISTQKRDKKLPLEFYRNYFCCGNENHSNYHTLKALEESGNAKRWIQHTNLYFCITDEGIQSFRDQFKKDIIDTYIPLKKSKQNYQDYIDSDGGWSFDEWLGIKMPKYEYSNTHAYYWPHSHNGQIRMVSTKYESVKGDWCKNNKEAKDSYKEKLKEYRRQLAIDINTL